MRIRTLYPGSWGANCYLLINGNSAAVVDPSPSAEQILQALAEEDARLQYILLTHGHFDHITSLDTLRDRTSVPAMIHESELTFPSDSRKNAFYYLFHMERACRTPEKGFRDGDTLLLGDEEIRVLHTPGHTCGSVCFLCNDQFLLTGDTLFDGDRGRTDLYSGNEGRLLLTLEQLRDLPQKLPIYPGHGTSSTLGAALDSVIY